MRTITVGCTSFVHKYVLFNQRDDIKSFKNRIAIDMGIRMVRDAILSEDSKIFELRESDDGENVRFDLKVNVVPFSAPGEMALASEDLFVIELFLRRLKRKSWALRAAASELVEVGQHQEAATIRLVAELLTEAAAAEYKTLCEEATRAGGGFKALRKPPIIEPIPAPMVTNFADSAPPAGPFRMNTHDDE